MSPIQQAIVEGRRIDLKGSLPGNGVPKGASVSIAVTANDGDHAKRIHLTKKLNEGGEGAVFATDLGDGNEYVAKIYLPDKLVDTKFKKLELMLSKSIGDPHICFPVALIENELGERVGFLMPRAQGIELGKSVFLPKLLEQKFPTWTKKDTVQLCLTILKKIKLLNDQGILLGDINGQNILVVSPTEVYFVDCDSYQIENYPCPAGTAHFTAPEAQGRDYKTFLRTQAMENFAIATLLFMIMLPGKPPYSSVGGASPEENIRRGIFAYEADDDSKIPPGKWGYIWSHMSYRVRTAFVQTFRKGGDHFAPMDRLGAEDWISHFDKYLFGLNGKMAKTDPMSLELFPTRPKLKERECKHCGKPYLVNPAPGCYTPYCPTCTAQGYGSRPSRYAQTSSAPRSGLISRRCSLCGKRYLADSSQRSSEAYCPTCIEQGCSYTNTSSRAREVVWDAPTRVVQTEAQHAASSQNHESVNQSARTSAPSKAVAGAQPQPSKQKEQGEDSRSDKTLDGCMWAILIMLSPFTWIFISCLLQSCNR